VALIEVGMGTAELFAKVLPEYDFLTGVELSQPMIDCAFKLHPHLRNDKVKLIQGNATELVNVLKQNYPVGSPSVFDDDTFRLVCMCMNTFGILPEHVRALAVAEMFRTAGPGGKIIIGCWHQDSLRTGYQEFYSRYPQLCGVCKESDFDFAKGNFNCSSSDYTSHWWSSEELKEALTKNYPGDVRELTISFEYRGIGIFAVCEIDSNGTLRD
jgi:SAM-dependent methyltransferase